MKFNIRDFHRSEGWCFELYDEHNANSGSRWRTNEEGRGLWQKFNGEWILRYSIVRAQFIQPSDSERTRLLARKQILEFFEDDMPLED